MIKKNGKKLSVLASLAVATLIMGGANAFATTEDVTAIVTASDTGGSGLWKIVATPSADAAPLETFTGEEVNGKKVFTFQQDLENPIDKVYIVDNAGNVSNYVTLDADVTAPAGTMSYENGTKKISVTDAGSGIATIGGVAQTGYPESASNVIVTNGMISGTPGTNSVVTVVDAVGNSANVKVDTTAPTKDRAFWRTNGENGFVVTLTATDTGTDGSGVAGLYRVCSDSAGATAIEDFAGLENTETVSFTVNNAQSLANVYLVDKGGNVSDALVITEDNTAPAVTGTTTISHGATTTITLTNVTDSGSGIVRIGSHTYDTPQATVASIDVPQADVHETDGTGRYIELEDYAGNIGKHYIDTTAPVVTGTTTYSQGTITLTNVTDSGSGIVRIGNHTYDTPQATVASIDVPQAGVHATDGEGRYIELEDYAGNIGKAYIDSVAPVGEDGYMNYEMPEQP